MHFKRDLYLIITGATIIIIAVLFGSKYSEANPGSEHNLPQIRKFTAQYSNERDLAYQAEMVEDIHAQSSDSDHR